MISLCITHRADEDISWVEDLYADLIIYDKGKNWNLPYQNIKAPKILNETDTYIRGIIDNYDNLHRYKTLFLLKPNCKDYDKDVISYLSINQYNQIKDHEIVLLSESRLLFDFNEMLNYYKSNPEVYQNELAVLDFVIDMMNNLGINMGYEPYPICLGSQYRVPTMFIFNKPKKWWILLQSYMLKLYDMIGDKLSEVFEFLWPKLFLSVSK
jgi:hypothetical protein